MDERTREPQYQPLLELRDAQGLARLGLMTNQVWHDDPKRLVFVLARYKFVAKLLAGRRRVLEVGCADAFATRLVQQEVGHVTAVDFDPLFVADARARMDPAWPFDCLVHDLVDGPVPGDFDAAYCLDVLEHIAPERELAFLGHLVASLAPHAAAVIGTPTRESQAHASAQSRAGHVNCKTGGELKELLARCFHHVFVFSMNDEVVHTGFYPLAHYLLALCCEPRTDLVGATTGR
jgi:SAM-dependent methyltransferase